MKKIITITLLALIPTFLLANSSRGTDLYGMWYDAYSDTRLEIKHSRKGIRVKKHGGWFSKWRTYNYMGRGLYDDCDGNIINVIGPNRIEWSKNRRYVIALSRFNDRRGNGYRDRDGYGRDDYRYDDGYRDRGNRSRSRSGRNGRDRFSGSWYCSAQNLNLSIEIYGNGIRARSGRSWTYYEPYRDHYRDRRGNRYYFRDNALVWEDYRGRRSHRFRRR